MVLAIAIFGAALFGFDRLAVIALDGASRRFEPRGAVEEKLAGLRNKADYQILVLGTSRTFEAVHPALIARALGIKAYKEAAKGKGPRYNYEFYRLYRRVVGKPRLVVYGVDYFMFGMESEPALMRRLGVGGREQPVAGGRWPLLTVARKSANDRAIVRLLEHLQQRAVSALGEFDPENNVADMERYTGRPESRVVSRPEPATYARVPFPGPVGAPEGGHLTALLDLCGEDGVGVMVVYPPDYIATYRTNDELDALDAAFERIVAGRRNCVFIDYSNPRRFPLSDATYFWDGDYGNPNSHLSRRGAEAFQRLLVPDITRAFAALSRP
jgi:hypothetical protein